MKIPCFLWVIIMFVIFGSVSPVKCKQEIAVRYFPNLMNGAFNIIEVVDSTFVIGTYNKKLMRFDGRKWRTFTPALPQNVLVKEIKAFSRNNIWIFYSLHRFYYHDDCYHFDGKKWQKILLPQPFHLKTIVFLDSMRFFAGGGWGSLIFFDGKKAKNISIPTNVHIKFIAPFSDTFFYAFVKLKDRVSKNVLMEFKNGQWRVLKEILFDLNLIRFITPDSGYMCDFNQNVFAFRRGSVISIKEFHSKRQRKIFINGVIKNYTYFWMKGTIWHYSDKRIMPVFRVPFYVKIYPIDNNEWFIVNGSSFLFYLGSKRIGEKITLGRSIFKIFNSIIGIKFINPDETIGVACYKDRNGKQNLYFTRDEKLNSFYVINGHSTHDAVFEHNLIEKVVHDQKSQLWACGVFFADMDNDGDLDAVMSFLRGRSFLFENVGHDYFENVTAAYHFDVSGRIANIVWCDINNDGYLDFFAGDKLGRLYVEINNGFGQFRNMRAATGLSDSLIGFNPAVADADNDGDPDLFLYGLNKAIRYYENTGLNQKTRLPVFKLRNEKSPELTSRFDFFTQSMRFADYDNDGDLDLILINRVTPSKFFENDGHGRFTDVSEEKGFNQHLMGYGANWGDLDQDGYQDIFVTTMGKNYIYWNHDGKYFSVDSFSLCSNFFNYSIGSVLTDLDNDGDLDIVSSCYKFGYSKLYENMLNKKNFLKIDLDCRKSNRDGIGSKIYLYRHGFLGKSSHLIGFREVTTNTGYASSRLAQAFLGCPRGQRFDVLVKFPSGITKTWLGLEKGRTYLLSEMRSSFVRPLVHKLLGLIVNPKRRVKTAQLFYLLLLIIAFNIYIRRNTYWFYSIYFFFDFMMVAVSALTYLLLRQSLGFWQVAVFLLPVFSAVLLMQILTQSVRLRYGNESREKLFHLIREVNHTKSGIKQINYLLFFLNNVGRNPDFKDDFVREWHYFQTNTLPFTRKIAYFTLLWNFKIARNSKIASLNRYFYAKQKIEIKSEKKMALVKKRLMGLKNALGLIKREVESQFCCNLFVTLNEVLNVFPAFTDYSVSFAGSEGKNITVLIRKQELVRIFENLLQNALEAMRYLSEKRVAVKITQKAHTVKIQVTDWGEVIPEENSKRIFEENFSTKGSSGLGLFHVKKILNRYGGDIVLLNSSTENGTTFEITLKEFIHERNNHRNDR